MSDVPLREYIEAIIAEGRIELRNFGVFELKARRPRKARNPRTGEKITIPASKQPKFKAGKGLKDEVK